MSGDDGFRLAITSLDLADNASNRAIANEILTMPEMEAIHAALNYALDCSDWFGYDYWPYADIPESVRQWLGPRAT